MVALEQPDTEKYQASSLLIGQRPHEVVFPLREDEFRTLCEGEFSQARASRNLSVGICITAIVGLAAFLAVVDWETSLKPEHRSRVLFGLALLLMTVAGSAVAGIIHQLRMSRASGKSPYSRLTSRIAEWFAGAAQAERSIPPVLGNPESPLLGNARDTNLDTNPAKNVYS